LELSMGNALPREYHDKPAVLRLASGTCRREVAVDR
jgi:hypothetical protein